MNKIEMKSESYMPTDIFEGSYVVEVDNDRILQEIIEAIDELRVEKELIKQRPKAKHHKKVIKDINRRLHTLNMKKQQFHSQGSGVRGDPAPTEEIKMDTAYVYQGSSKPKTGSGDKRRLKNKIMSDKQKKKKKW